MKISPFGNNVLVQPAAKSQVIVSDGGTLCEYGKVIAIGDEVKHIKVGDEVGFLVWGIRKLVVRDETFYFLSEDAEFILGFVEE